jgi:hypothetical protein
VTRTSYGPARRPPDEGGKDGGVEEQISPVVSPESDGDVELGPLVGLVAVVGSCPREASQPATPVSDNTTAAPAMRAGVLPIRFRGTSFGVSVF